MRTGGDFGNYATISCENVNLRDDNIAENGGVVGDDSGGSFVTRTLDGKDFHEYIIA